MPLQQTSGNVTADAFGGGKAVVPTYIEDVFSTWLYTGNGSTQTITNGIDLAGKGGLVWLKARSNAANHVLSDTVRGNFELASNSVAPQKTGGISYGSAGFTVDNSTSWYGNNNNGYTYAAWTFRKAAKFFDVVTYTGDGSARTIAHNLGSVPGCIIVKCTTDFGNWWTWHRGLSTPTTGYLSLNSTDAEGSANLFDSTLPTSTVFSLGAGASTNSSGQTYVAYLFAHNAGGFGLTGTDNVISCGSYTTDGAGVGSATLGYEPQWVLFKLTDRTQNWVLMDNMRNFVASPNDSSALFPNLSNADSVFGQIAPDATGFSGSNFASSATYIYIAIRRGPMKVPTDATKVFSPVAYTGTGTAATTTTGFVSDLAIIKSRGIYSPSFEDRLRGANKVLESSGTSAEVATTQYVLGFDVQNGVRIGTDAGVNASATTYVDWAFQRAPGFFDVVCYTGTGVARTINHNLTVVPELMIVKNRTGTDAWYVTGAAFAVTEDIVLNSTAAKATNAANRWNSTRPTASVFSVGTGLQTNDLGDNYVWYGFATCAGVSKCGSYTGNGTTQTIDCGFAAGARFVLIKRTDSTGGWYVYDTARGMTTLTDPYLFLNSTAAEVATLGSVTTVTTGFALNSAITAGINVSGGTYIFLAVA